jgi:hypothetical protein
MKKTFLILAVTCFLATHFSYYAQTNKYDAKEIKVIDGTEIFDFSNMNIIESDNIDHFLPLQGDFFTYNINLLSGGLKNGYDYQSSASPQQVWVDLNNPSYIHSVFTYSFVADGQWADRTSFYFGSIDAGANWFLLGGVPVNNGTYGRSGFPALYGTSTGRAVITNHNNFLSTPTRTKIYYDTNPFEYSFSEFDPQSPGGGISIWPRIVVLQNNRSVFASSINGGVGFYTNTLLNGVFSGWQLHDGDQAETYSLAASNGGKVGLAYLGQATDDGDVFYKESTDEGLNWTTPIKIWDAIVDPGTGDFFGCLRGICLSFYGEQPCVVFELGWMTATGYYPQRESEIRFWRPAVNGGVSIVLADSSIIPLYPSKGTNDVFFPICRPVIGRSQNFNHLFVAFNATSGEYWPGTSSIDSTSFFAGYFMFSGNGGETWTTPEKFTPEAPLRDWRYISMAQINPVSNDYCTVHMVVQVDSVPGSNVSAYPPMPVGVTAQYYHISTTPILIPVELTSFTARLADNKVILNWQTATETNNQAFEIQRKTIDKENVGEWLSIGFIVGKGTTTEPQFYEYSDDVSELIALSFVYRLKQMDFDGSFEFSKEVTVENDSIPVRYTLLQNYPNPFNPSTKIKFTIPNVETRHASSLQMVTLKVYDILGNEIVTLVNEELYSGEYEIEFSPEASIKYPASGIYFYQLAAGEFIQTKKMVLIK